MHQAFRDKGIALGPCRYNNPSHKTETSTATFAISSAVRSVVSIDCVQHRATELAELPMLGTTIRTSVRHGTPTLIEIAQKLTCHVPHFAPQIHQAETVDISFLATGLAGPTLANLKTMFYPERLIEQILDPKVVQCTSSLPAPRQLAAACHARRRTDRGLGTRSQPILLVHVFLPVSTNFNRSLMELLPHALRLSRAFGLRIGKFLGEENAED